MSKTKKNVDLSMMTHLPLQPSWLLQLPAFQSSDARVVRASLHMLMAAFHGQPAGSLPLDMAALATASHLTQEEVTQHYTLLTTGWKKAKDRLVFEPMADMASRLSEEYSQELRRLQDGVAVAIAAPDLFNTEMLPEQGAALEAQVTGKTLQKAQDILGATSAKRLLPKEVTTPPPAVRNLMLDRHFTADMHDEIWQRFYDFHQSRGTRSANWTAEFRNWLGNQVYYGRLNPKNPDVNEPAKPATRTSFNFNAGGAPSRAEAAKSQASESLSRAQRVVQQMRARANGA